ncbi:DUF1028 domain-containing protein [Intrasporangium calvum]|uniref:DUF1028 domain-containing protein n=1 Tax=Intrasporangium calvum TaxID=53358 RepID=UPI000DF5F110|nr:DUF1028 domain-containing protein [Intrasporangium calvum]AXG12397.1 DUF1028 domain-containing protein [Intrasporangium calvum]
MTFSIVAREGEAYGVAVASKFLAVGAVVPGARVGVGAVATQSWARVAYIPELLGRLEAGEPADSALDSVTAMDPGGATRQVGVVGRESAATFTGDECTPWCGGVARVGDGDSAYAIQGNILVGPEVVAAMERAWLDSAGVTLPQRLLAALVAGDAAGGDARGRQSAAIYVVEPGAGYDRSGVAADLRVDDHADPVTELRRLLDEWEMYFGRPEDVRPLEGDLAAEVGHLLERVGHSPGEHGVEAALVAWAGEVNYESRLATGGIDRRVLEALRASAAAGPAADR